MTSLLSFWGGFLDYHRRSLHLTLCIFLLRLAIFQLFHLVGSWYQFIPQKSQLLNYRIEFPHRNFRSHFLFYYYRKLARSDHTLSFGFLSPRSPSAWTFQTAAAFAQPCVPRSSTGCFEAGIKQARPASYQPKTVILVLELTRFIRLLHPLNLCGLKV